MSATLPTVFGPYRILELIERIGGSHICLARQTSVDRLVTLTVLPPEYADKAAYSKRFQRQVLAASRLRHPNIVCAIDAGEIDGFQYIAAEYAGDRRLGATLDAGEWFPLRRCIAIALDIARALEHLQSRNLVHRGLNPRAIVLADSGVAKLRSFSLSKLLEGSGSETWFDVDPYGAKYMAPELVRFSEEIDTRTDIYALGCVLHHLLTGAPPFDGSTSAEIMKQHALEPAPDPREHRDGLPRALLQVLGRCLEKDAAQRYAQATDLVADLESIQSAQARRRAQPTPRRGWLSGIFGSKHDS